MLDLCESPTHWHPVAPISNRQGKRIGLVDLP
jgi:hypothetical protein